MAIDLERDLRALGAALDLPPAPDLAAGIRARLEPAPAAQQPPRTRPRVRDPRRRAGRRLRGAAGAHGDPRVLRPRRRLGHARGDAARGGRASRGSRPRAASCTPGRGARPRDVRGLRPRRATPTRCASPTTCPGGQVSFIWRDEDGEIELLLSEFRAGLDRDFVEKMTGPDTTIEQLEVNGEPALWLGGAPHAFGYRDPSDEFGQVPLRLAGPTLLWQRGERDSQAGRGFDARRGRFARRGRSAESRTSSQGRKSPFAGTKTAGLRAMGRYGVCPLSTRQDHGSGSRPQLAARGTRKGRVRRAGRVRARRAV